MYLQLRLPYGQPEFLAKIQASLVEQQQLLLLHPLECQRIDTLARDLQDARDSIPRDEAELERIKGILVRLQTESDSLTVEIQGFTPRYTLDSPTTPKL